MEVIALRNAHFTSRRGKKQIVFYFCQIQLFIFLKKNIIYYFTQTDDINVFLFISNVSKFVSGTELAALNCNINSVHVNIVSLHNNEKKLSSVYNVY